MKGNSWPGMRRKGPTQEAPDENEQDGDEPAKRIMPKVDPHNDRPPLADEPFGNTEENDTSANSCERSSFNASYTKLLKKF